MRAKRNAYRNLVGKPKIKRPLRRRRHWWEDNIKIDFRQIRWGSMDCIVLAQNRDQWRHLANVIMNLQIP
jgi:hypothetical protein